MFADQVSDPQRYGVIEFANSPDGDYLKSELKYLLDNDIKEKGEYQLTNALENMKAKGTKFSPGKVSEWLDCGNKNATVYTNSRILEFIKDKEALIHNSVINNNSIITEPCFIGENVKIINSKIGPHVSIGANTIIENSIIKNSMIQTNSKIVNAELDNSMIGNFAEFTGKSNDVSLSDYSTIR